MLKKNFFFVMIFLSSCCCYDQATNIQMAFTKQYAQQMHAINDWKMIGFGGSSDQQIKTLSFSFQSTEKLNLETCRRLIIKNIEYLYNLINSNYELQSFLIETPFDESRILLSIMFIDSSKTFLDPPYIAYVTYLDGKIGYATHDRKKNLLDIIHRETYEEALQIINAEKGCLPLSPSSGN